jgi:hypothetical protein
MIKQWQENPDLLKEAEILFRQMEQNGITGRRNIVLMDMAVTGKTILYVKAVLKYFSERNGIKIDADNIRGFVSFSHDRKLCLPEVRFFDNLFASRFGPNSRPFKDQLWPFYRIDRDAQSGEVYFAMHQKKFDMLTHVYRSLRVYNAALDYARRSEHARRLGITPLQKKANKTVMASEKINRDSVHSVLYAAASNSDMSTLHQVLDIFPNTEKIIYVDPAYARLVAVSPELIIGPIEMSGLKLVGKERYDGILGQGGRLILIASNHYGKRIELQFYSEDYNTFVSSEITQGVDANIVKYPGDGGDLSEDYNFYKKVIRGTAVNGYILVRHAKLPSAPHERSLKLLVRTKEDNVGSKSYVSGDDWVVYLREKPSIDLDLNAQEVNINDFIDTQI